MSQTKLGIAIVGLGGAVGTTMVAGIELLKKELIGFDGLPLKYESNELAKYEDIVFAGWDLNAASLAEAAAEHDVLSHKQFLAIEDELSGMVPWKAVQNKDFVSNIEGTNLTPKSAHRETIACLRNDLQGFNAQCEQAVVINLASTERLVDVNSACFRSISALEEALDANSAKISPAMIYAYAAISEGIPYGNFTPSTAADVPALIEFAHNNNVPIAGKDGKTGQTFIKTVLAPALYARALKIDGWYSTNLLGNRDGFALSNEDSLASKIRTKQSVLRSILGYEVEDHIVDIRYYKPRGDNKEAWDNIDFTGFLGQTMQLKVNFLCKDSILAAPLAIEIARCLDLAKRRGQTGIQEQLSVFFKLPMSRSGNPEHAFHKQEEMLIEWLQTEEG